MSSVWACAVSRTYWPFSRNCIVHFSHSLSWFSLAKTHPAYTKPDLGSKHIPGHSCPFAASHVWAGHSPFWKGICSAPHKKQGFLHLFPLTPHFLMWLIPLDVQITPGRDLQECLAVARLFWFKSNQSNTENQEGFTLLYGAVLFSSHFLLFVRHESNYNLKVVCLQQGEMYFGLFHIYNLYICQKLCVVGQGWTWLRHLNSVREGMVVKFTEHQRKPFQTQMFQEIKQ